MMKSNLRIAFAGDRDIAVWVLQFLLDQGVRPVALCVSSPNRASHANELISLCSYLTDEKILKGKTFRSNSGVALLKELNLDYIIGIHFPYIVPEQVLSIPRQGVLNLHPAYLPYNRGWHTPSWAILDDTPIGATLHFMDIGIDTGAIIHQKEVNISSGDTAHTLYKKLKHCEFNTFKEAWPDLVIDADKHQAQNQNAGTTHKRQELFSEHIQKIDLQQTMRSGELIKRLRALTTNNKNEAAYYEDKGKRFYIQVTIHEKSID